MSDPAMPLIKVCVGPPCLSEDPENCPLCFLVDPADPEWESKLEAERRQ